MSDSGSAALEETLRAAFAELGQAGALGDELSDDELLAGLFDVDERAALEAHAARLDDPPPSTPAPEPAARRGWLLLAISVSAAACALLLLSVALVRPRVPSRQVAHAPRPGASAAMTSTYEQPARWAHPGERHQLERGDCRRISPDVRVCSPLSASLRVGDGSRDGAVELELEAGEIELDGRNNNGSVVLQTPIGRVLQRDQASRFRVAFDHVRRQLQIEVLTGAVVVERDHGERDGHVERVELGAGARINLDPSFAARTPEQIEATPDKRSGTAVVAVAPDTPEQLLRAAQRELAAGDRKGALARYRTLIDRHANTNEGQIARVSLGRLLLADGQHQAALREFDGYLELGATAHALDEEARYGRLRCLKALGRSTTLRDAIDDFEIRHPNSLHHSRLASWRAELEGHPDP